MMWDMLKTILSKVDHVKHIEENIALLEDKIEHDESEIAKLKSNRSLLEASNKTLAGRLIHAETCVQRLQEEVTSLKMCSMHDNILIKTRGREYKGSRD